MLFGVCFYSMVEVKVRCRECGSEIDVSISDDSFVEFDEFHECAGEKVGVVGLVTEDSLSLNDDSFVLEVEE